MLPIPTTGQARDGIQAGDFLIDLSDYMKKQEGATKTEIETLTAVVAGKLDAEPIHKHDISEIKQLENVLAGKYDTSQQYSYNVILSDSEKIPYLESPKVGLLELTSSKDDSGYKLYVDESNGDLMIILGDILVASYTKSTHTWSFAGVSLDSISSISDVLTEMRGLITDNSVSIVNNDTKINAVVAKVTGIETNMSKLSSDVASLGQNYSTLSAQLNEYITKTDAIMKNHYEALRLLCEEHGMIDSNVEDGDKITPGVAAE